MKKRGKSRPKAAKASRQRPAEPAAARSRQTRPGGGYRAFDTPRKAAPAAAGSSGNKAQLSRSRAIAAAPAYEPDEQYAIALLLLPFLIIALSLGLSQTLKPVERLIEIARPHRPVAEPVPLHGSIALAPLVLPSAAPAALRAPERIILTTPLQLPQQAPAVAIAPAMPSLAVVVPPPPVVVPLTPPAELVAVIVPPPPIIIPLSPPTHLASIIVPTPPVSLPLPTPAIRAPAAPAAPDTLACLPAPKREALSTPPPASEFGLRLAQAAQAQTNDFVIYSAAYKRIAYPMGDVPSLYGACSDLVIRAYRALGVDLQDLVQRARVGSGDPNIDHRRTETLRAFFTRHGEKIPPSTFAEDYKPGDIVTYYRPYSRVSRAHIAIVSETIGPSGRPMIVHNRGWGPQLEDALFVDRITGHYRFAGAPHLLVTPGRMAAGAPPAPGPSLGLPFAKAASAVVTARTADRRGQLR